MRGSLGPHAAAGAADLTHTEPVQQTDQLTGLATYAAFHEALLAVDGQTGADRPVSIVLVDVFRFRDVNEVHGHVFGDEMLRAIATLLCRAIPEATMVARVGGDEFALLLDGIDEEGAATIAEDLRAAAQFHPGVDGCRFLLSVGHATCPPEPGLGKALQTADHRLYESRAVAV